MIGLVDLLLCNKYWIKIYNLGIYNQLLLNILRVISQKYGHNL